MEHTDWNNTNGAGYMKLAGVDDQEYDALADLFLGQSELAPEPISYPSKEAQRADTPSRPRVPVTPIQDTAVNAIDLIGDVQMRLDDASEQSLGTIPCIEAVLLGHLPVRASLWVRQYACSTARRRGEIVALIRAAAGSTSVDLISGTQGIESRECASLHEALVRVHRVADRIILRVDETTEPELLDRDEIDEITILTGADEAAVVASYRLIKTLTSVWDSDEAIGTPHLRLAVMGATGQQVADASAKLTRAVDAFLDRPIEIIDAAGRIDATGTTNIFRDSVAYQASSILDELIEIGCGVPSLRHELQQHQPRITQSTEVEPKTRSETPSETPSKTVAQTVAEFAQETTQLPDPIIAAPVSMSSQCVGLFSLIKGLTRLETRCPFALDVELCVDGRGSLHLVAGGDHDRPMTRIETVRAWVRDHLLLILRAEPALAMPDPNDRDAEIGLHLISSDPDTLRGLIDSPVRVYALAEVTISGQSVRVATAIN